MKLYDIEEKSFGSPYGFLDYIEEEMTPDSELTYGSREIQQYADVDEVREFFELLENGRDIWFMDIVPELEQQGFDTLLTAEIKYHSVDDYGAIAGSQEVNLKVPSDSRESTAEVMAD